MFDIYQAYKINGNKTWNKSKSIKRKKIEGDFYKHVKGRIRM